MPRGPQGQKRPADVIGNAIMIGRIATGEIEDPQRDPKGVAGGKARAARLSPNDRSEIARIAAEKRWQEKGNAMTQTAKQNEAAAGGRGAVRMYSNNSLKEPVRAFNETFSGLELLKNNFTK